jgi:hypothetical protein
MIKILILMCVFSQIKDLSPDKKWDIEIVTRKTEQYNLLVTDQPVTFTVEGPTYLRVYTRIPWPKNATGEKIYKIILQDNYLDEEIKTFETERSSVTKDKLGRFLSKWRSFYIEVDEGLNNYKMINWYAPNDTIIFKIKYEAPKKWKSVAATNYGSTVEAIEGEKIVKYYVLNNEQQVSLGISGPVRLKVISRLNYSPMVTGEQVYTVLVADKGNTDEYDLKCYKSETIKYRNRKDVVPSNARSLYINVGSGWHELKFSLSGTVAKEAALRFLVEE